MTEVQVFDLTREIYGPRYPCLRLGQWAFICLHHFDAELANKMVHLDCNPFYHDDRVDDMLKYLLEND